MRLHYVRLLEVTLCEVVRGGCPLLRGNYFSEVTLCEVVLFSKVKLCEVVESPL